MRIFDGDDDGYLAWVSGNQHGFVVNTFRHHSSDYLVLHKATCKSISRTALEPIPWTTGPYVKVCSLSVADLDEWARETRGGSLSPCGQCHPIEPFIRDKTRERAGNVFDRYPHSGRALLGRPKTGNGTCRLGYGLSLQRLTGETNCAYCGISLIDTYHHWLLMSIDHVVPTGEARRVGINAAFYEDSINLVLCCAGCNGFGNRYRCAIEPQVHWTLEEFLTLRDATFADRFQRISTRRNAEIAMFEASPWQ